MAVVTKKRYLLRGKVRAQVREAIGVCQRLLNAAAINPDLPIFAHGDGPGSATSMEVHLTTWQTGLETKG